MHLMQPFLWAQSINSSCENSTILGQRKNKYIHTSDFNIFFSLLTSRLVSWTFCLMSLSSLWVSFNFLDSAYEKKTDFTKKLKIVLHQNHHKYLNIYKMINKINILNT